MKRMYYISLGSNQGDRAHFLQSAAEDMKKAGIQVTAVSSLYETPPWGYTEQAPFLNAAAAAVWDGPAEALLREMLRIEKAHGRTREIHWGPRTLDLDLLYGDGLECRSDFLTLPHPFFWDRAFVLVPLAEIAPDFRFRGESIRHRIGTLSDAERIVKYKEWIWG